MAEKFKIELSDFDCEVIEAALMHFTTILSQNDYDYVNNLGCRIASARFSSSGAVCVRSNPFCLPE